MLQVQFPIPAGRSGITMQRCVEAALEEMRQDLEAHRGGERMYPEDVEGCSNQVRQLWGEIKDLRNLASFSLSNAIHLGSGYLFHPEDPLMIVTRHALLLEFIDQELGEDSRSSVGQVMNFILLNPILYFPDSRPGVRH